MYTFSCQTQLQFTTIRKATLKPTMTKENKPQAKPTTVLNSKRAPLVFESEAAPKPKRAANPGAAKTPTKPTVTFTSNMSLTHKKWSQSHIKVFFSK
jgi:hypothetical protein